MTRPPTSKSTPAQRTAPQRKRKSKQSSDPENLYEEYDSPWKEIIERLFPHFMHFFYPDIAAAIDWSRPPEFLDKEFQRIAPCSGVGRHTVDKLIKVWLLDGAETWFLIHIEVQSQKDEDFPARMYVYRYRIYDKYKRRVVSLAILGDDDPLWSPSQYKEQLFGCTLTLTFPSVKLLDYEAKWQALEQSSNPFAVVVMAHLKAIRTHQKQNDRLYWKKTLIKILYERNYPKQEMLELFRYIDWILKLPEALDQEIQTVIDEYEEARQMKYVTSVERMALKKGYQEGQKEGRNQAQREMIVQVLQFRFPVPEQQVGESATATGTLSEETIVALTSQLNRIEAEDSLKLLLDRALEVASFGEFLQTLEMELPVENG